jgi:hypothetical protein
LEEIDTTDKEPTPEEMKSLAEEQEVPKEEAVIERAPEGQRPAVVCRNPWKRRTRSDFARGAPVYITKHDVSKTGLSSSSGKTYSVGPNQ